MKKKLIAGMTAAGLAFFISSSFADDPSTNGLTTGQAPLPADSALLQQISSEVSALPTQITASMVQQGMGNFTSLETFLYQFMWQKTIQPWIIQQNYTPNPNQQQQINVNTITIPESSVSELNQKSKQQLTPSEIVTKLAQHSTEDNVENSLLQFPYQINKLDPNNKITTAQGIPYAEYEQTESVNGTDGLILGSQSAGSDTLYITNLNNGSQSSANLSPNETALVSKPKTINDAQFDFSTLMNPVSYSTSQTKNQLEDARRFLKYAAMTTQDLTAGIHFSKLNGSPAAVAKLKNDADFQKFMMKIRNIIALRSISLYVFNELIAERTPVPGLGAQIGEAQGTAASPLQVEAYRATHDLKNPTWYQEINNEPPATIQRDILVTLKEIEAQNYQTQRENERLLSVILAMSLSNASSQNLSLQIDSQKINGKIDSYLGVTRPQTPQQQMKNAGGEQAGNQNINTQNLNTQNINEQTTPNETGQTMPSNAGGNNQ